MKSFLLFFTLLAITSPIYASVGHTCIPKKDNSDISKVTVSYLDRSYVLLIAHIEKPNEEVKAEYYDDMTFIGFYSEAPQYDLHFFEENSQGIWTEAVLKYGENFKQRLELLCN